MQENLATVFTAKLISSYVVANTSRNRDHYCYFRNRKRPHFRVRGTWSYFSFVSINCICISIKQKVLRDVEELLKNGPSSGGNRFESTNSPTSHLIPNIIPGPYPRAMKSGYLRPGTGPVVITIRITNLSVYHCIGDRSCSHACQVNPQQEIVGDEAIDEVDDKHTSGNAETLP